MNIRLIADGISSILDEEFLHRKSADVGCVKLMEKGAFNENDILFVGHSKDVPQSFFQDSPRGVMNLALIGKTPETEKLGEYEGINLLFLKEDCDLFSAFNKIQDARLSYNRWTRELENEAAGTGRAEEILRIGAKELSCPMCVVDINRKLLYHIQKCADSASLEHPLFHEILRTRELPVGSASERSLLQFLSHYTYTKSKRCRLREEDPEALLCNIVYGRRKLGTLALLGAEGGFPERYETLAQKLCESLALAMVQKENKGFASENAFERFMGDIVNGEKKSDAQIAHMLSAFSWKPEHFYFLIKIERPEEALENGPGDDQIGEEIEEMFPGARSFLCNGALYLLFNRTKNNMILIKQIGKEMEPLIRRYSLYVGFSNGLYGFSKLMLYHDQPNLALRFGRAIHPQNRVFRYSNYQIHHLIDLCAAHTNIENFIHPAVKILYNHDKENGTEYIKTLIALLNRDRTIQRAADDLHVHRNTFTYRLEKMFEMTKVDFSNDENTFYAKIACSIVEYVENYEKKR